MDIKEKCHIDYYIVFLDNRIFQMLKPLSLIRGIALTNVPWSALKCPASEVNTRFKPSSEFGLSLQWKYDWMPFYFFILGDFQWTNLKLTKTITAICSSVYHKQEPYFMNFLIWKTKNSEEVSNTDSCPSVVSQILVSQLQ